MAIDAKASFLRQMEKKLETTTTAAMMSNVLSIIADVMEGFDMREVCIEEEQDDMLECFLQAMDVQGRSRKTISHYRLILGKSRQKKEMIPNDVHLPGLWKDEMCLLAGALGVSEGRRLPLFGRLSDRVRHPEAAEDERMDRRLLQEKERKGRKSNHG